MTTDNTPAPYYAVCSDTDPLARAHRQVRMNEYAAWRACLSEEPDPEPRDWTEHAATLSRSIGCTPRFIAANLGALETLDQLPQLRILVEALHHLGMNHLRKIDDALLDLPLELREDPEFWELLDQSLSEYLSPTRPNQLLPETSSIRRRIAALIRTLKEADPETTQPPNQEQPDSYHARTNQDGSTTIEVTLDPVTSAALDAAVRSYAEANDCSRTQATAALLLRNVSVKVILNIYRASDITDAPAFLSPAGWLNPEDTESLLEMADQVRDMDLARDAKVNQYQASESIRAYLEGRDGLCRWPGCTRPADRSQKDHQINHAEGGETTASQMISVCQHHHNRKTDGQIFYLLEPHSGDVYWLFSDGSWVVDRAEGPLAPRQRHWVQTLAQYRKRRQERAREKAAREEPPASPEPVLSTAEPPPF